MQIEIIEGRYKEQRKLRVCAYCRVSTDAEEQENSLENQIAHYRELIQSNPDYEYIGVYSDFAISGYKEKRPGLQQMLADARAGKIDLILTKSVSRFARNTRIVLEATRELRELNVGVFFELQNINTLSGEGELMLTIIAAFAQAESESGSVGAKMVYRRKYEQGISVQYLDRSFGYTKDKNGNFVPDMVEAEWIKIIYKMAAEDYTPTVISHYLNEKGIATVNGAEWTTGTVIRILENEICKGDYIMHKHYVNDDRKLVRNRGKVDAWYIEDDHKGIVSQELWQEAQKALERKREYLATGSVIMEMNDENYPYRNKVFCSECGHPLYPRVYSNGNRLNWGCSGTKRYGKAFCEGVNVPDSVIREWNFENNIYIRVADDHKGRKEFVYLKEQSWKRRHKKKVHQSNVPKATVANYPYMKKLHCALCGSKLTRHINTKNEKIFWICGGNKRKGSIFCKGVRVPDEVVRSWGNIEKEIYIVEMGRGNGFEFRKKES